MRLAKLAIVTCLSVGLVQPASEARSQDYLGMAKVVGVAAITYGPQIIEFIGNVSQFTDRTDTETLGLVREQGAILQVMGEQLARMEFQLDEIRAALEAIDNRIEQLPQMAFSVDARSIQSRIIALVDQIPSGNLSEIGASESSFILEESIALSRDLYSVMTAAEPILRNSDLISPDFLIAIGLLSQSSRTLLALQVDGLPPERAQIFVGQNERHLRDLSEMLATITSDQGLLLASLARYEADYETELNRVLDSRPEFRAMYDQQEGFCAETRHASDTRETDQDQYFPLAPYQRRNRETGQLSAVVYSEGYVHFRHANISVAQAYIEFPDTQFRLSTGLNAPLLAGLTVTGEPARDCNVLLEDRDLDAWMQASVGEFNQSLELLEPYAVRVVASHGSVYIANGIRAEIERTLTWLESY